MEKIYQSIFNSIAVVLSSIAIIMFIKVSNELKGHVKHSYILISFGILIAVTIHSFFEHLEVSEVISTGILLNVMPILITIGSIFFIIGGYILVRGK